MQSVVVSSLYGIPLNRANGAAVTRLGAHAHKLVGKGGSPG